MKITYENNVIDHIDVVYVKNKTDCRGRSNWVRCVRKTRQDSNVTDRIGLDYIEIDIEFSGPILLGVVYEENQIGQ